jgi:hypothetical protein
LPEGAAAFGLIAISTALDFLAAPAAMPATQRHRRDRSLPRPWLGGPTGDRPRRSDNRGLTPRRVSAAVEVRLQ